MTATSKAVIKSYFETGDKPTQQNFIDLIDSYQNASDVLNYITTAATTAASGLALLTNGTGGVAYLPIPAQSNFGAITVTGNAIFAANVNVSGNVSVSGQLNAGRITDWHSFYVTEPLNQTYDWVRSSPYGFTIVGFRRVTSGGDVNIDIRKNNVSIVTYSASAAAVSAAASAAFAQGDTLTVVTTSASACSGLAVYAQIARVL